jgi:hypothetical protein
VNPLNAFPLAFPILECFHLLGFIAFVGTTAVVDFRLLGLGMRRQTAAELARNLTPWTSSGLLAVLLTGPLLFSSDPEMYRLSRPFQVKMVCLSLALVFHYTVHRRAASRADSVTGGSAIACVSLALWTGVIAGGIFMGFA